MASLKIDSPGPRSRRRSSLLVSLVVLEAVMVLQSYLAPIRSDLAPHMF